jgi:uncharacterized membrane protein YhaH (DUF805 family)
MGFGEAVQKGIANIGNFEGRATRPEFWWFVLAVWIVLVYAIFNGFLENMFLFIIWIVAFIAYVSVGVRRLHDVGQPGWMIILAFLCCLIIVPLYFWVQPSQGPNQYGPPAA